MLGGVLKKTNSELTPPLYAHMPPMQPEQKKKKKRITPELIAGPGSGAQAMGPQMGAPAAVGAVQSKKQKTGSSTGYLRVKRAADDRDATLAAEDEVELKTHVFETAQKAPFGELTNSRNSLFGACRIRSRGAGGVPYQIIKTK